MSLVLSNEIYEKIKEKLMLAHQHNKSAPICQESNQQTINMALKTMTPKSLTSLMPPEPH